jgi:hypothetical protein
MKRRTMITVLLSGMLLGAVAAQTASDCPRQNTLSDAEKKAGWRLLFDGKSLAGWHGYNGQSLGSWTVEDCAMKTLGTKGNYGSDLRADAVTDLSFENFEIRIDWKTTQGGNSGIMYGVVEDKKYKAAWMTGPEYQFIDDIGFPEKLELWQKTGGNYAMHPPNSEQKLMAVGEWNNSRLLVKGAHVEHWLNGKKVVEFERWNEEWNKLRNSGKWKEAPDYGLAKAGRIALQDHGSIFWFRNIKIREIK